MRLGKKQELFSELFAELITYIYSQGYQVRLGDTFAHDRHKKNSNHYIKLAGDINLFKDGKFLTKNSDHEQFGVFWESLHRFCRWGARFGDGNHYSLIHNRRM